MILDARDEKGRGNPSSRGRPQKVLALACGLIGFLAALAIGWSAGLGPALVLWRAALVGLVLGAVSLGFGAVGQQVLREVEGRRSAAVFPGVSAAGPSETMAGKSAEMMPGTKTAGRPSESTENAATGPPRAPPRGTGPSGTGPAG